MAAIVSIIVAIILAITAGMAHLPAVRAYALQWGQERLAAQGLELEADTPSYNLFTLKSTLTNVRLRSTAAPDLPPFFEADRVDLDLSLLRLARGELEIESGRVTGASVRLVYAADGRSNLPEGRGEGDGAAPTFRIQQFEATGPLLSYEDRGPPLETAVRQWRLRINGENGSHRIRLSSSAPGSIRFEEREATLAGLRLDVSGSVDAARVREAQVRVGETELRVEGDLGDPFSPQLAVRVRVRGGVRDLARLAGAEAPIDGSLRLNADVSGAMDALEIAAQVRGEDLTDGRLAAANASTELRVALGEDRVEIRSFTLDAPWAQASGSGSAGLTEEAGTSTLTADFSDADLEALARWAEAQIRPAARATGSVQAEFPGLEVAEAALSGNVRLSATRREPARDVLPVAGRATFQRRDGRTQANLRGLQALGATLNGPATVGSEGALSGALELASADLAETVRRIDLFLGSAEGESVSPTAVAGPLTASVVLSGTTDSPRARVQASADSLTIGDLNDVRFAATAAGSAQAIEVEALTVEWSEQRLEASGRADLTGESPALDFRASTTDARIADLLRGLGNETPADGLLSFEARIGGTADAPTAAFTAAAEDLVAYAEPFGRLETEATFADGRLEASRLRLEKPQGRGGVGVVEGSGFVDFEDDAIDFALAGDDLRLSGLEAPNGETLTGTFSLDVQGGGTVSEPAIRASLSGRELKLSERELGSLQAEAALEGDEATLTATADRWNTRLRAQTSLEGERPMTATLDVEGLDLSEFGVEVRGDQPLTGLARGRIEAAGNFGQWEDFTVDAQVSELILEGAGQRVGIEGEARASYRDRRLEVGRLVLLSGESRLEVSGALPLEDGGRDGRLRLAGGIDISPLPAAMGLTVDEAYTEGIVQLDGTVDGTLTEPEPRVEVSLANGIVFLPQTLRPVTDLFVEATLEPAGVEVRRLDAEWALSKISGRGTAATALFLGDAPEDDAPRTEFEVSISGLNLGVLQPMPDDMGGRLSATLEARAASPTIEALQGSIRFSELELTYLDLALRQQEPSELRLRDGVIEATRFDLRGARTTIRLAGTAGITGERPLALQVDAEGDAGVLTLVNEDVAAGGRFELSAAVAGTVDEPEVDGGLRLSDARMALEEPRVDLGDLNASLRFSRDRVEIESFAGELNGGPMTASGGFGYGEGGVRDVNLSLEASELFLDFPEGFRTLSRVQVRAESGADELVYLRGRVDIEDGSMREQLDLESTALDLISADGLELASEPDPFLSRIRYDVAVKTENPVLVDNNLARLEAQIDLRLAGSYYRPALLGRVMFEEGGEVYLAENDYVIETGSIDFLSETRIEPSLNLTARTQAGGHEITLRAQGDAEDLDTEFTSDSGLSEPDIISLLLTGRTLEDAQESGLNIAREQALSYLTGRLGGRISRAAEDSLGLSRVRIEPNLIAPEDDPSARLTVGQNITRALELIYSMNLTDSGDQIFVAEYDVTRMFVTRGVKQDDNSYRFDFRHDVRFGLGEERRRVRRGGIEEDVGEIRVTGDPRVDEAELRDVFGIETGDRYDFFKTRKRADKVAEYYHEDLRRLEARVRLRRTKREGVVDLELAIDAGPKVELIYEGVDPPGGTRKRVEEAWIRGVFEEQRTSDAADAITAWLDGDSYYQSQVEVQVEPLGPDEQRVLFDVARGPRFESFQTEFRGASAILPERLELILDRAELRDKLRSDPREVAETLQRYYRQEGYLTAEVDPPELEADEANSTATAVVAIREGPLFEVGALSFTGARAVEESELRAAVTPSPGSPFTPRYLEESVENVEELYWQRGYNDVTVNFNLTRVPEQARVDVELAIEEHEQDVVREIAVDGNRFVGDKLIQKRMANEVGSPLIAEKNDRSRRRLYDTGAFALVDFEAADLERSPADEGLNPVKLTARIREVSPYRLRYGAFFDTERGPGMIADFENRNTLGSARVTGLRARYDQDFREGRAYYGQPLLLGLPIQSSATVFRSREFRRTTFDDGDQQVFITDRTGFTLQQEMSFKRKWILNYGYRFERARVFDQNPDPFFPFDITVNVAPLLATLSYDSRDELLDATRGQFFSHGVEYAPGGLGSSVPLAKYFGQYFRYRSFFRPEQTPFDRKRRRPRLTWASGARIGLSDGLGDTEVIPFSERFFAGGGTTIRGFVQDGVGPKDFDGAALGGEAVFLMNHEARFPVLGPFEGVGFLDVGNVYEKIEDFDLSSMRSAAGVGLRVRTPVFLLRLDYGFKLDRKPGESQGAFFFSIGQAF